MSRHASPPITFPSSSATRGLEEEMVAGPIEQQHVLELTHNPRPSLSAVSSVSKSYFPASSEVINARAMSSREIKMSIQQAMSHEYK